MRIIPNQPIDTNSRAELKLFEVLKRCFNENDNWRAYHSLNLESHSTKRIGEIDFLILSPYGLIILEVKGGGVTVKDGKWYTVDKRNKSCGIQNPFTQAKTAMFSIQKTLIERKLLTSSNLIAFASVFPDIMFEQESVEWSKQQILDKRGLVDLEKWLYELIKHAQQKQSNQHGLSEHEIINIDQYLRPEFEQVCSLFHPSQTGLSNTIKLNIEQLDILEAIQKNERYICEGAAGTGKTLLAIELVKRLVTSKDNVLLLCRSSYLKSYLKSVTTHENLTVSSLASLEMDSRRKYLDSFDAVVIDEGQDIYDAPAYDLLDKFIDGGINKGNWYIFQDSHFQKNIHCEINTECFIKIKKQAQETLCLSKNYRNTRHIVNFIQRNLSVPLIEQIDVCGALVFEELISQQNSQKVADSIENIINGIPKKGSITLLSPLPFEQSIASKLPVHLKSQLTRLDDYLMNHFPSNRASFCEINDFKGLENDYVILLDMPQPTDNLSADLKSQYYVALTRARMKLFCLWNFDSNDQLPRNEEPTPYPFTDESLDAWAEIISITYLQSEALELQKMNVEVPICGYELVDDSQVQAAAEFAWEDAKLAIFTEDDDLDIREFQANNWQCFQAPLSKAQLSEIARLLK